MKHFINYFFVLLVSIALCNTYISCSQEPVEGETYIEEILKGWIVQSYWFETNKSWDDWNAIPTAVSKGLYCKYSVYNSEKRVFHVYFDQDKKIYTTIFVRDPDWDGRSCYRLLDRKNFWRIIDLSVMVETSFNLNPRISGWSSAENLDF